VAFCWLVEFAQLSPYPAELSDRSTLARLVLGSTFNPPDLFWYVAGVAVAAGADLDGLVGGDRGDPRGGGGDSNR
jgi:hypothetical protein